MEVGPTCHYVMGGVEVDPDTGAAFGTVRGLFAAGEVSGGMHGSNRLGGNSLSDLLVFGKRAGEHAASYADQLAARPKVAGGRGGGRGGGGARAAAARHRREPVHPPAGPPGGDGGPGRHHPPRGRAGRRADAGWPSCGSGWRRSARPAADATTRAGTWPWTCATCWSSRSAPRRRRWSGRSRAAGTPGRTSRRWSPEWRQVNLVCALDGDAVRLDAQAAAEDAGRADRPLRPYRAGQVPDRRGAGRLRRPSPRRGGN